MLKKKERLTKAEFDRFFSGGTRFHGPHLQLIYTPHPTFHGAVVVGKKVYKKAVDRNRLRRRLYSVLYHLRRESTQTGVHIVITKPAAKSASFAVLKEELCTLVGRVGKTR